MLNLLSFIQPAQLMLQLSEDKQREAGVTPDMIRLSIGIEDTEDLIDDLVPGFRGCRPVGFNNRREKLYVKNCKKLSGFNWEHSFVGSVKLQ